LDVEPQLTSGDRCSNRRKNNVKNKYTIKAAAAAACVLAACQVASATLTINSALGGNAPLGASKFNFDDQVALPLGTVGGVASSVSGPSASMTVSFIVDGQALMGAVANVAAPPWLTPINGVGFGAGGGDQADGVDATTYLTTGKGTGRVILTFADTYYLGLLWGSIDTYNSLDFYDGATLVGTVTGSQVTATPNGNQGANGTRYVNIFSDVVFDKVVARSEQAYAFEFDNVAVPEPTTMIAGALLLLPFGASTMRFLRKSRKA
jgi:hypothetical protein